MESDIKIEKQARGTRIISGEDATFRRAMLDRLRFHAIDNGFGEIVLPSLELAGLYEDKAGPEVLEQMYCFDDRATPPRRLCLRPEGTATIQAIAREHWSNRKDVKGWYEERCWRYERPQAGRYREFTQFGVEWLWPSDPVAAAESCLRLASLMVAHSVDGWALQRSVKRGLAYYQGDGFEISVDRLGAQKQVCGGGPYAEGFGFAIGVDRLCIAAKGNREHAVESMNGAGQITPTSSASPSSPSASPTA